jgi:hypothetical protein
MKKLVLFLIMIGIASQTKAQFSKKEYKNLLVNLEGEFDNQNQVLSDPKIGRMQISSYCNKKCAEFIQKYLALITLRNNQKWHE